MNAEQFFARTNSERVRDFCTNEFLASSWRQARTPDRDLHEQIPQGLRWSPMAPKRKLHERIQPSPSWAQTNPRPTAFFTNEFLARSCRRTRTPDRVLHERFQQGLRWQRMGPKAKLSALNGFRSGDLVQEYAAFDGRGSQGLIDFVNERCNFRWRKRCRRQPPIENRFLRLKAAVRSSKWWCRCRSAASPPRWLRPTRMLLPGGATHPFRNSCFMPRPGLRPSCLSARIEGPVLPSTGQVLRKRPA